MGVNLEGMGEAGEEEEEGWYEGIGGAAKAGTKAEPFLEPHKPRRYDRGLSKWSPYMEVHMGIARSSLAVRPQQEQVMGATCCAQACARISSAFLRSCGHTSQPARSVLSQPLPHPQLFPFHTVSDRRLEAPAGWIYRRWR